MNPGILTSGHSPPPMPGGLLGRVDPVPMPDDKFGFLLDQFGGAAAAYSLRRLRTAYTGPVVRVRRSSDNAELNFRPSEIQSGQLAAWAGTGNGFVVTWFDQSGNGRDATQTTTTLQPQIISSGALILLNGMPSIDWANTSTKKLLTGSNVTTGIALTFSAVFSSVAVGPVYRKVWQIGLDLQFSAGAAFATYTAGTQEDWLIGQTGFLAGNGWGSGIPPRLGSSVNPIPSSVTSQSDAFGSLSASRSRLFVNDAEISYRYQLTGNCGIVTNAQLAIGNGVETLQQLYGRTQEIIIWFSNRSEDRQAIRTNQKAYYSLP